MGSRVCGLRFRVPELQVLVFRAAGTAIWLYET